VARRAFVIHVNEMQHYPDAVYVGRAMPRRGLPASPFANPFRIGRGGDRALVLDRYRAYLLQREDLLSRLGELAGRPLACWCRFARESRTQENTCHADVLIELLDLREQAASAEEAQRSDGQE
jgi:hypothetical protein